MKNIQVKIDKNPASTGAARYVQEMVPDLVKLVTDETINWSGFNASTVNINLSFDPSRFEEQTDIEFMKLLWMTNLLTRLLDAGGVVHSMGWRVASGMVSPIIGLGGHTANGYGMTRYPIMVGFETYVQWADLLNHQPGLCTRLRNLNVEDCEKLDSIANDSQGEM